MINLLPGQSKKELALERTVKKISVFLFFLIVALFFLLAVLSFLKFSLLAQIETIKTLSSKQEQLLGSAQFQNFKQTITQTNQNLAKVEKFYQNQISVSNILKDISIFRYINISDSIYFTNFSFKKIYQEVKKKDKEKEIKIRADVHVNGWAKNRKDLFLFKKELEKIAEFQEIYFSPSSWTEPENIDFSFSFKIIIND